MKFGQAELLRRIKLKNLTSVSKLNNTVRAAKYTTLLKMEEGQKDLLMPKRINYVENFKTYIQSIIPEMERSIEVDLLKKYFSIIQNPEVQESLIQAYIRRILQIKALDNSDSLKNQQFQEISGQQEYIPENVYSPVPLKYLSENQIGLIQPLTYDEFKKIFMHKSPGDFKNNHIVYTKNFSLLLTEEGVKMCDYLSNITTDPKVLDQDDLLQEDNFQKAFSYIKSQFGSAIKDHRKNTLMERLFGSGFVFDSLVMMLINECQKDKKVMVPLLKDANFYKNFVKEIMENCDKKQLNSQMPDLFQKTTKKLKLNEQKVLNLLDYETFPTPKCLKKYRFKNFQGLASNYLVYGNEGAGKSGFLMQTIMWAHAQDWIVVTMPSAYDITQVETETERHHETGLYVQNVAAKQFLQQFCNANEQNLKQFKVNQDLYGFYNFSGVHDNDPDPTPNIYDERRKYHFKDYQKFETEQERKDMLESNLENDIRLKYKILKNPQTLFEIVRAGIENQQYATQAVYETLEQLYNSDQFKVLVAVDGFNWFYRPSIYPSFRYASDMGLKSHIPPYHLSLSRAFMNMDGHKIKNGCKIMTSSIYPYHRNKFDLQMIHVKNEYGIELNGIPLDHFRHFCEYCLETDYWLGGQRQALRKEQLWMETQGNFLQIRRSMREAWRDI